MARHSGSVLVHTNVILECHRTAFWRALTGGYSAKTVQDCVTERQAGFRRWRAEQGICPLELHASLAVVHIARDKQRSGIPVEAPHVTLIRGETSLWAGALHRIDCWLLCEREIAGSRVALRPSTSKRLVSLKLLLNDTHRRLLAMDYAIWRQLVGSRRNNEAHKYCNLSKRKFLRTINSSQRDARP